LLPLESGSSAGTRTQNPPVTLIPAFPQGVDYLIIHMGCRALWDILVGLLIPSLCTFPATGGHMNHRPSPGLAQDYRHPKCCGFPEFTRFFATRRRVVLLGHASQHEFLRGSSDRPRYTHLVLPGPSPKIGYSLLSQSRTLCRQCDGKTKHLSTCHIHTERNDRLCTLQPLL